MKKLAIAVALAAGLGAGSLAAVHAKLPAPPPMTDAEKAAKAEKAAAEKAREGELNAKAQDKAVANYKKGKGIVDAPAKTSAATTSGKK